MGHVSSRKLKYPGHETVPPSFSLSTDLWKYFCDFLNLDELGLIQSSSRALNSFAWKELIDEMRFPHQTTDKSFKFYLQKEFSLHFLSFANCALLTPESLEFVKFHPELRSLDLTSFSSSATTENLNYLVPLTNLRKLFIPSHFKVTKGSLSNLQPLSSLTHLCLPFSKMKDKDTKQLTSLTNLRFLNVGGCFALTDESLFLLSSLRHLKEINIGGWGTTETSITDKGISALSALQNLKSLNLYNCAKITDQSLVVLNLLPYLEQLDISCCSNITDQGLLSLNPTLKSLNLGGCRSLTNKGLENIQHLKRLKTLNTGGWTSTVAYFSNGLVSIANLTTLKDLKLYNCISLTDQSLGNISSLSHLCSLDISCCGLITDFGIKKINSLSWLQNLNLGGCKSLSNGCLNDIGGLIKLVSLNLGGWGSAVAQFTDKGIKSLSKCTRLEELNLYNCRGVTNSGIKELQKVLTRLHHVDAPHLGKEKKS